MSETTVLAQPQIHDQAWVNQTLQAGPSGARFDTVDLLLGAANLPDGIVSMYDSTQAGALPVGSVAYAGYYNGSFANLNAIRARFPASKIVSVTPDGEHGAMYIDVEPGCSTCNAVPGFIKAGGVGFYASPGASAAYSVAACIDACDRFNIPRDTYCIWSAHWIGRHICGPTTCGYPKADGTQYVSTAAWDESAVNSPVFFDVKPAPAPPPPKPVPVPVPKPVLQMWKADGKTTLAEACATGVSGQTVASVLTETLAEEGDNTPLGSFLNQVFAGSVNPVLPAPVGVELYRRVPAPPPAPAPKPAGLPAWQTAMQAKLPDVRSGDTDKAGQVTWVRQVQLLLLANDVAGVTVDGSFGPMTKAGVESWQERAGLLKTGWVDPATWETLLAGKVNTTLPTLDEGSTDTAAVRRVQALCGAHGLQLVIDGSFGPGTKAAVVAVQKVYYPADAAFQNGIVGPGTWSLLAAHSLP